MAKQATVVNDRYGWAIIWPDGYRSAMPDEKTARSAAAAPDLLACLIEFVQCNDGEHTIEMYQRARAAIAKAEGRAA